MSSLPGIEIPESPRDGSQNQRNKLKEEVKKGAEYPKAVYEFRRSEYEEPVDEGEIQRASIILEHEIKDVDTEKEITVTLKGTADRVHFRLDRTSRKPRVDLERGIQWQENFLDALKALQTKNVLTELIVLNFQAKGIYAVHDLPLFMQQKVMNHAIAYLRAERLQSELESRYADRPNIKFNILTAWMKDNKTRVSTIMEVGYEGKKSPKKPPRPMSRPTPGPEPKPRPTPESPAKPSGSEPVEPPEPERDPIESVPFSPDEMIRNILTLKDRRYEIARSAKFVSDNLIQHENEMTISRIVQNDNQGKRIEMEGFFILEKGNRINPNYYILMNRSNPYQISIGKMVYKKDSFESTTNPGPIKKVIHLDGANRTATLMGLQNIFNRLP